MPYTIKFLHLFLIFFLIFSSSYVYAEQAIGSVNIVNFQTVDEGGTVEFTTAENIVFGLTLPTGTSGDVLITETHVETPSTDDGSVITSLGIILELKTDTPNLCVDGCTITLTFDDDNLTNAGLTDPSQVVIFQDSEEDGTFVPLPTVLIDASPPSYTVYATTTTTSFFSIGVLDSETFCGKKLIQWFNEGVNVLAGSNGRDVLRGTPGPDVIIGLGGNDVIFGRGGDDCLVGGDGNDQIVGGSGNDIIFGNNGNDRLHGGRGNDIIDGGEGNERITGNSGDDVIVGGNDNDILIGNLGDDIIFGGSGNDLIFGNQGNDVLNGFEGIDKLYGGVGNDQIFGYDGNDVLNGAGGNDHLDGGADHDRCNGGLGYNTFENCES